MVPQSDANCTWLFLRRTCMVLAKYIRPLYVNMLFKTPISFDASNDAKTTACHAWLSPRAALQAREHLHDFHPEPRQHGALSPRGARLRPRPPHHRRAPRALLLGTALARSEPQLIRYRLVVHKPHASRLRARPAPLTRPPPRRLRGRSPGPGSAGGVCVCGGAAAAAARHRRGRTNWTRRVQLVRRDGRDVSTLYGGMDETCPLCTGGRGGRRQP
jgi:hypothetical protein